MPNLALGKAKIGVVVAAPAGDHSYLMTAFRQSPGDAGQLLGRGHEVGPEALI
jgi:hypothetical protein